MYVHNLLRTNCAGALHDKELFIIEGSPTAETGAQLRDNPEEREKGAKCAKKKHQLRHCEITGTSNLVDELQQQEHRPPSQVLHLRYFHSFCTVCTIQPVVAQRRACPNRSKNLANLRSSAQFALCVPVSVKQLKYPPLGQ